MDRVAELERALADALLELKAARKFDRALKVGRGWWACEYAETDWFALETARSACNQNPVLVKMIGEVDVAGVVEWCSTPRASCSAVPRLNRKPPVIDSPCACGYSAIGAIAFALAMGIAFDAVVVRMVAVPATLALLGRAAWWLPGWLRWLPTLDVEGATLRRGAVDPAAGRVEELAGRFEVTPQTIRKDLNDLCDQRLLTRTHGGAILASGVAPERLVVVERDPMLHKHLVERFPGVKVLLGDALVRRVFLKYHRDLLDVAEIARRKGATVIVVTETRALIVSDRRYVPEVEIFELGAGLTIHGRHANEQASLTFTDGERLITVDQIVDVGLAVELANTARNRTVGGDF